MRTRPNRIVIAVTLEVELPSNCVTFSYRLFYEGGRSMSAYPGISHFELSQNILGHVILSHGVHHKVLVSG